MGMVVLGHALQEIAEARQPVPRFLGKVRAAEEGALILGREEHGQRPAAVALRDELLRQLIDLVEVRALLAVHLDVDEQPVHQRRDPGILERFVRHDMAPMTGGVTHREEDGLVPALGEQQRFFAPRIPIDGIFRVLQQIRAGFEREAITPHLAPPT